MKVFGDKRTFSVGLALVTLIMAFVMVHGCGGVSSYQDTPTATSSGAITITMPAGSVVQVNNTPVQLTATYNSQDVTTQVTWSSDHPEVASISSTGLVTANTGGRVTITAEMGGQTGTLPVTVYASSGH